MDYRKPPTPDTPPPRYNPQSPASLAPKTPIDRGRRPPRLVLPTPNATPMNNLSPYPQSLRSSKSANSNGNPYQYPRKESEFVTGLKGFAKSGLSIGEKSTFWIYNKVSSWSKKWFTHFFLSIVLAFYTVGGALLFKAVEGKGASSIKEEIRQTRYALIALLRNMSIVLPQRTSDGEWQAKASLKLIEYEDAVVQFYKDAPLIYAHRDNDEDPLWSFSNAVMYCATIFTTIGYGHIYPTTGTGRALTIVYAIIGIPLFLIALTDFGKLFTRCIKFFWSFVRRVYYTGSCRRARKTAHVEDILQGAQIMYEIATLRRPSMFTSIDPASLEEDPENPKIIDGSTLNSANIGTDTPTTPAPSNFEIDDEFNLPISLAIFMLVLYIFLGALMYCALESEWGFFESFYFVFISMSTIGFGDMVPKNPLCMVASIVYLVFGLALMSMCINVVQVKLSDTFKDASSKLGATIGLNVNEDDGSIDTVPPELVEVPDLHAFPDNEDDNKEKKNGKNGIKKEKKSSMKVKSKDESDRDDDDNKIKTPKEVKF